MIIQITVVRSFARRHPHPGHGHRYEYGYGYDNEHGHVSGPHGDDVDSFWTLQAGGSFG